MAEKKHKRKIQHDIATRAPYTSSDPDGSVTIRMGTINPFKRLRFVLKQLLTFNTKTNALVLLFGFGLSFLAIAFTVLILLLGAGPLVAAYVLNQNPIIVFNSLGTGATVLMLLSVCLAGLIVWLISLYILATFVTVALATIERTKLRFREIAKKSLRLLPRIALASIVISFIASLLTISYIVSLYVLSTLGNAAPTFIIGTILTIVYITVFVMAAIRLFLYAYFLIADGQKNIIRTFALSRQLYNTAPGYTFALLLVGMSTMLLFMILVSVINRLSGLAVLEAATTLVALFSFLTVTAVGYVDVKAAREQPLVLKTTRGTIFISLIIFVLLFASAIAATPKS